MPYWVNASWAPFIITGPSLHSTSFLSFSGSSRSLRTPLKPMIFAGWLDMVLYGLVRREHGVIHWSWMPSLVHSYCKLDLSHLVVVVSSSAFGAASSPHPKFEFIFSATLIQTSILFIMNSGLTVYFVMKHRGAGGHCVPYTGQPDVELGQQQHIDQSLQAAQYNRQPPVPPVASTGNWKSEPNEKYWS